MKADSSSMFLTCFVILLSEVPPIQQVCLCHTLQQQNTPALVMAPTDAINPGTNTEPDVMFRSPKTKNEHRRSGGEQTFGSLLELTGIGHRSVAVIFYRILCVCVVCNLGMKTTHHHPNAEKKENSFTAEGDSVKDFWLTVHWHHVRGQFSPLLHLKLFGWQTFRRKGSVALFTWSKIKVKNGKSVKLSRNIYAILICQALENQEIIFYDVLSTKIANSNSTHMAHNLKKVTKRLLFSRMHSSQLFIFAQEILLTRVIKWSDTEDKNTKNPEHCGRSKYSSLKKEKRREKIIKMKLYICK